MSVSSVVVYARSVDLLGLRGMWSEPAPSNPPANSRWDYLLTVGLCLLAVSDGSHEAAVWPIPSVIVAVCGAILLLWRRRHVLHVSVTILVLYSGLHALMLLANVTGTIVGFAVLPVMSAALGRWASGRHLILGSGLMLLGLLVVGSTDQDGLNAAGVALVWLGPLAIGVFLRLQARLANQAQENARASERYRIARELHDTVAHHVSAIVIQTRAAQAMREVDPVGSAKAMSTVERSAQEALAEMRGLVGTLRDDAVDRSPQPRISDISKLTELDSFGPHVDVHVSGELAGLGSTLEAGVFRIAQESVANARQHAREATKISIRVVGSPESICLTIEDDGNAGGARTRVETGFGLIGMQERALLLGGTFEAGPQARRGWLVRAELPRRSGLL